MAQTLDDSEMARWIAWKRANDAVLTAVAREIQDAAGLSAAEAVEQRESGVTREQAAALRALRRGGSL
ncbi:hypothetical protein ACFQ1S_19855 [Kibdelosporangium lantanae]|uniref:Uncharacterized protein n=1 Tax=Kibdelosporangium lantanae TaxID=1497396 RepID=A0ABW3MD55_9PSEU